MKSTSTSSTRMAGAVRVLSLLVGAAGMSLAFAQSAPSAGNPPLAPMTLSPTDLSAGAQDIPPPAPSSDGLRPISSPGLVPVEGDLYAALSSGQAAYELRRGETLKAALTRWTEDAGWTLVWRSGSDYTIDATIEFPQGTKLADAARDVLRAVWRQHPQVKGTVYKNNVLVIEETKA